MQDNDYRGPRVARVPANVDAPDRVVMGLTARQAGILAVTAVLLYGLFRASGPLVPPLVFLPMAALVLAAVTVAVTVRRDGLSLDLLAVAAWRHQRSPRRQVLAPEGVEAPPHLLAVAATGGAGLPAAFESPVKTVDADGVLELGRDGASLLASCSTVNFALRTGPEQELLISGFARWLNALTGPVQVACTSHPVQLSGRIAQLRDAAPGLPHPALEAAAREHADFLVALAGHGHLLDREVLLAVHEHGPDPAPRLARRVAEAAGQLAACEITARALDAACATATVQAALSPSSSVEEGF